MYIAIYKTGIISSLTTCTVYISFDSFKSVTILESHAIFNVYTSEYKILWIGTEFLVAHDWFTDS